MTGAVTRNFSDLPVWVLNGFLVLLYVAFERLAFLVQVGLSVALFSLARPEYRQSTFATLGLALVAFPIATAAHAAEDKELVVFAAASLRAASSAVRAASASAAALAAASCLSTASLAALAAASALPACPTWI